MTSGTAHPGPRHTGPRRALAAAAVLGIALGGLGLAAPAASAKPAKSTFTSDAPPLSMVIPDQPPVIVDALAEAVEVANELHPEDPFFFGDLEGPSSMIGYADEEQGFYSWCKNWDENGTEILGPCVKIGGQQLGV
jgi:hypothetical protein